MNNLKSVRLIKNLSVVIISLVVALGILVANDSTPNVKNSTISPSLVSGSPKVAAVREWNRTFTTTAYDYGVATWTNGSFLYTVGYESDGSDYNLIFLKWDLDGNEIWNRTWGLSYKDEWGSDVWGDSQFIFTVGQTEYKNLTIQKWDPEGNVLWNVNYTGGPGMEIGKSIWGVESGGGTDLYVTGYTSSYRPDGDCILMKWHDDGTSPSLIWNNTWNGFGTSGSDDGNHIWANETDIYVLARSFSSGVCNTELISWDVPTGTILWNTTFGNPAIGQYPGGIYVNGAFIFTGGFTTANDQMTLVKWWTNGTLIMNCSWGGPGEDMGSSLWGDGKYVYIGGETNSYLPYKDFLLTKWDFEGQLIWNLTWGGAATDWGQDLSLINDSIYMTGSSYSFSSNSDLILLKVVNITQPLPPTLLPITPSVNPWGNVGLNWSKILDATNYSIYRANSPVTVLNEGVICLATVTTLYYNDTGLPDGQYFYAIIAHGETSNSTLSNSLGVTVELEGSPDGGIEWWIWVVIIVGVVIAVIGALYLQSSLRATKKAGKRRYVAATLLAPPTVATGVMREGVAETRSPAPVPISPEVLIVSEEEEPKGEPGIYTFRGGRIVGSKFVYKVKVKNSTDTSITDVVVQMISYPRDCMKMVTDTSRRVEKIEPGGFRSLEYELLPMKDCVEGSLVSSVVYLDAKNQPHTMAVTPFTLKSVCDLMEPLPMVEVDFDNLIASWAKTGETIKFKGEDVRALAADLPAVFESKNFHSVTHKIQESAEGIVADAKAIAIGKYTKRKMALVLRLTGSVKGSRGDGEITCMGFAEDSSMLAACLSEILDEFRKPLVRLIQKTLKDKKDMMEVTLLQTQLRVDAHVLADAVRQQPNLVFLRGGESVAHYDYIASFINNMRSNYNTIPVKELEADLRPVGKTMHSIVQELIGAGQVRATWVGNEEIKFKMERHKLVFAILRYAIAIISGLITIILALSTIGT